MIIISMVTVNEEAKWHVTVKDELAVSTGICSLISKLEILEMMIWRY